MNSINEVKITLEGLTIGMYVSRLDIPWIETSFLLEGLKINSDADINKFRDFCQYVYVDTERGSHPHPNFVISDDKIDKSKPRSNKLSTKKRGGPEKKHNVNPVSRKHINIPSDNPVKKQSDFDGNRMNLSKCNGYEEAISSRRKRIYKNRKSFLVELKTATAVHQKLSDDFKFLMSDITSSKSINLSKLADGITDLTNSIIRNPSAMTWVAHIKRLDEYSYSRALGAAVWCATFGRHLGLEKSAIETLSLGGLLLDIGKSKLPESFLNLTRELSPAEFNVMCRHVKFGDQILTEATRGLFKDQEFNDIKHMILDHHERADGSGYPNAIKNEKISFFGRMAGIVDSFNAMTSDRPFMHSKTMSPNRAVNDLYELRGTKFQSELVEQFIQTVGTYPTGSMVELNTGEVGIVVSVNSSRRLRPTIMLILDKDKKQLDVFSELDLDTVGGETVIIHGLASGAYEIDMAELFL